MYVDFFQKQSPTYRISDENKELNGLVSHETTIKNVSKCLFTSIKFESRTQLIFSFMFELFPLYQFQLIIDMREIYKQSME